MTNQLPPAGAVFLDHVAHFVPEMDAAATALERCGFRLTPFTVQTNRVNEEAVPAGTGNRCAMLRQGYLEILTATAAIYILFVGVVSAAGKVLADRLRNRYGLAAR